KWPPYGIRFPDLFFSAADEKGTKKGRKKGPGVAKAICLCDSRPLSTFFSPFIRCSIQQKSDWEGERPCLVGRLHRWHRLLPLAGSADLGHGRRPRRRRQPISTLAAVQGGGRPPRDPRTHHAFVSLLRWQNDRTARLTRIDAQSAASLAATPPDPQL